MDETQFTIQIVEVKVQTLGATPDHFQLLGLAVAPYREGGTWLQGVEHTNQALLQMIFRRNLLRQGLFALTILRRHGGFQVLKRTPSLGRQLFGMLLDLLADPFNVSLEVFQQHPLTIEQPPEGSVRIEHGEMTLENHPIKCAQRSKHAILVYTQKCIHGLS